MPGNAKAPRTARTSAFLTALLLSLGCDPPPAEHAAPAGADDDARGPADEIDRDDVGCVAGPEQPAPRMMFVLDKSSSMGAGTRESAPTLGSGPSRWARTHGLVASLADDFADAAQLGVTLFSYADAGDDAAQCDVLDVPDLPIGDFTAEQLLARIPGADAVDFAGGSPASAAMWTALQHRGRRDPPVPTAIVLVTDGGAAPTTRRRSPASTTT